MSGGGVWGLGNNFFFHLIQNFRKSRMIVGVLTFHDNTFCPLVFVSVKVYIKRHNRRKKKIAGIDFCLLGFSVVGKVLNCQGPIVGFLSFYLKKVRHTCYLQNSHSVSEIRSSLR